MCIDLFFDQLSPCFSLFLHSYLPVSSSIWLFVGLLSFLLVLWPSCMSPIFSACPAVCLLFMNLGACLCLIGFLPAIPFYIFTCHSCQSAFVLVPVPFPACPHFFLPFLSTYSPATPPLCLSQYLFLPVRLSSYLSKILYSFLSTCPFFLCTPVYAHNV